jgi:thymidylate synthase|tara:strand:+ start:1101 stop:2117 length:1017 start_codon:yes stop_codon:yes gene_type:complete
MLVINCRNVNDGFIKALDLLSSYRSEVKESRIGSVVEAPSPVSTVFLNPTERVLFEEVRKANPFFHFMESLWMLGGCNDLEYVELYNKRMREYSDDGVILHGAYGHRWREHFGGDQLGLIIERLKLDPLDRRCVLQIWDARSDLNRAGVDIPCNTNIYFKIIDDKLNMTVSNRSNDIIWGTFGANAVHMSFLQEFIANSIGVEVGTYTQVSDSFHAYIELYDKLYEELSEYDAFDYYNIKHSVNPYENKAINPYKLMSIEKHEWENDLVSFLNRQPLSILDFEDNFFNEVACPLQDSWYFYKEGKYEEALIEVQNCVASDWCTAGFHWLNNAIENKEK